MHTRGTIITWLVCSLCLARLAGASLIHVSGDVTGTWSADSVIVDAEVRVPAQGSLTIEPGVEVLFPVDCKFIVNQGATLDAQGTPADSIRFDSYAPPATWRGLRFMSASDACTLSYCHIRHAKAVGSGPYDLNNYGGGILIYECSIVVSNCLIDSCNAWHGGGIACYTANHPWTCRPTITGNTIRGNVGDGGGINCWVSGAAITGNTIIGNSGASGGGIACGGLASPGCGQMISGNTISDNVATSGPGGGLLLTYGRDTVVGNTLSGNRAPNGTGGGIALSSVLDTTSTPTHIQSNLIVGNSAKEGGGISCYGSVRFVVSDNVVSGNSAQFTGGGIRVWSCNRYPYFGRNKVTGNSAGGCGGGIYIYAYNPGPPYDSALFEHNEVSCNSATGVGAEGGGYWVCATNIPGYHRLVNETIVGNRAPEGGGIYCHLVAPDIKNTVIWGNDSLQIYAGSDSTVDISYSDIEDTLWAGMGNISADPLFVYPDCPGDYHLQGGSPCIDTGDPDPAYNDPDGTRADMGCYYWDVAGIISQDDLLEDVGPNLLGATPNPFSGSTVVRFNLVKRQRVKLTIHDVSGRTVTALCDEVMGTGIHQIELDGSGLAVGIYFCMLTAGDQVISRKIVLIR